MSSLEYIKWTLASKKKRWDELREVLNAPWNGDRGWEGRTIGLHLPLDLRNFAIKVQEKLQLKSMKEVLFKALVVGLKELDSIPATPEAKPRLSSSAPPPRAPRPSQVVIPPPPPVPKFDDDVFDQSPPEDDDDDLA